MDPKSDCVDQSNHDVDGLILKIYGNVLLKMEMNEMY